MSSLQLDIWKKISPHNLYYLHQTNNSIKSTSLKLVFERLSKTITASYSYYLTQRKLGLSSAQGLFQPYASIKRRKKQKQKQNEALIFPFIARKLNLLEDLIGALVLQRCLPPPKIFLPELMSSKNLKKLTLPTTLINYIPSYQSYQPTLFLVLEIY